MSEPSADLVRRVAARLADPMDSKLLQHVEQLLESSEIHREPVRFDPTLGLALASLVISAAGLGWTIYNDLKNRGGKPQRDAVIRRVRVKIGDVAGLRTADRDQVIEVVVDEIERELSE